MVSNNKVISIAHLIYRLDVGGLERVMINCINHLPSNGYQHIIISLTTASDFAKQLTGDIDIIALDKRPGADLSLHKRLYNVLRGRNVDILHTYNLATVEYHPVARLAGIKGHIHAEHGRDIYDPEGKNWKHNLLRKIVSPFIDYFVPVSQDLESWLIEKVGISARNVKLIYNGINLDKFKCSDNAKNNAITRFATIARLSPIKDQQMLLRGFAAFLLLEPNANAELCVIGDGELKAQLMALSKQLNLGQKVQFLGERNDIPELLQTFDVFVLTSLAEGIPMTILEAMASGVPIISTRVGGIPEIIEHDVQGLLIEKSDIQGLGEAMRYYCSNSDVRHRHGLDAVKKVEKLFSEAAMVQQYQQLYQTVRT
ncbi:TIGR03088 family PEP-CTERM/XrtA system glycosyltransferase [Alteromonadaceae bacterium BrNp21-10]|nr:TIGR03088 family PEP-CTERM/XrtA system glycosyltransferase [Alteromonadaceae bacterium BrNp21-10]